ncbi:hypothetical protein JKP88DRAFT_354264 [Tribonema minus]|uniref:Transcriptional adapter n=1 Tax=Tribonema minus TaxID=303371 RepID=A0A836CIU7_9STRA|nr:hypothetical protein JKP88DRAFT_354264 [Tribonema minus]
MGFLVPHWKGEVTCKLCKKKLGGTSCRLRCAQCPDLDMCLDCFSSGAEGEGHTKDHAYRPAQVLPFPLFREEWTAGEELLLLEGIKRYSIGNWEAISTAMFKESKTADQIRQHYLDDYLGRFGHILPPAVIEGPVDPADSVQDAQHPLLGQPLKSAFIAERSQADITRRGRAVFVPPTPEEEAALQPSAAEAAMDVDASASESAPERGGGKAGAMAARRTGSGRSRPVPPKRSRRSSTGGGGGGGTPASDHGADADDVGGAAAAATGKMAAAAAAAETGPLGAAGEELPFALSGYSAKRQDFDVEHENDAEQALADMEFSPEDSAAERELKHEVIRIYNAKLAERARRREFVVERRLLDYRGVAARERRREHKEDRELAARLRVFARLQSREEHEAFVEGVLRAKALRRRIEQLQAYRRAGLRTLVECEAFELTHAKSKDANNAARVKQGQQQAAAAAAAGTAGGAALSRTSSFSSVQPGGPRASADDMDVTGALHPLGAMPAPAADPNAPPPLDISQEPGFQLLSAKEASLCAHLRLLPQQYTAIKDALVRESFARGIVPKDAAAAGVAQLVTCDISQAGAVYDFTVSCGWLASESHLPPPSAPQPAAAAAAGAPAPEESGLRMAVDGDARTSNTAAAAANGAAAAVVPASSVEFGASKPAVVLTAPPADGAAAAAAAQAAMAAAAAAAAATGYGAATLPMPGLWDSGNLVQGLVAPPPAAAVAPAQALPPPAAAAAAAPAAASFDPFASANSLEEFAL